jgi:hypothetical protein
LISFQIRSSFAQTRPAAPVRRHALRIAGEIGGRASRLTRGRDCASPKNHQFLCSLTSFSSCRFSCTLTSFFSPILADFHFPFFTPTSTSSSSHRFLRTPTPLLVTRFLRTFPSFSSPVLVNFYFPLFAPIPVHLDFLFFAPILMHFHLLLCSSHRFSWTSASRSDIESCAL